MSEFFFAPPSDSELFCHRQQRVARDRVETVVEALKKDLTLPFAGNHRPGSRMQSVLPEPNFFKGDGTNHSPVPTAAADGKGGHLVAIRII